MPNVLWLTRLARPQWTVGGRFGEAFPLSTSNAPPRHPVSTSLILTVTLTLSTSDSIELPPRPNPSSVTPAHSISLFLSLFVNESSSSRPSRRFSAIRTEEGGSSAARANAASARARARVNLIREKRNVRSKSRIRYLLWLSTISALISAH